MPAARSFAEVVTVLATEARPHADTRQRGFSLCGRCSALAFCFACQATWRDVFPQGWRFVPGDLCRHGTFLPGPRDTCASCRTEAPEVAA